MTFDLAIIGAGPGGYVAAIRAARLGAKVALIEKDEVGGTCLNWGCIPTKALAAFAHAMPPLCKGREGGVDLGLPPPSPPYKGGDLLKNAQSYKDQIVQELRAGVAQLLKAAGVEVVKDTAVFAAPDKIEVDGLPLDAENMLIATGSKWWVPAGITLDGKYVVSSNEALAWDEAPKDLLIVGGGVIGCEFASIFQAFGSKITVIEATSSILPPVERAISRLLARSFKERGIEILTDTTVAEATIRDDKVSVRTSKGDERIFDRVLVCVGRRPNPPQGGGFELTDRGAIKVNEKFETSVKGVYAIGDVIGGFMLAHVASAEGISCVEQLFGKGEPVNYDAVPSPIFTTPEIATVGRTAEELTAKGVKFKTGRFPYAASGKARCDGETEGMVIVHTDEKGLILGAHLFGKDATVMVAEATLAVKHRLTAHDVGGTIHAHPTMPEAFAEAALDAVGEAIHKSQTQDTRRKT